jgi:5-methylcytosine-specific restriction endonuclease McrA
MTKNPGRVREVQRQFYRANPDRAATYSNRRRTRKLVAGGSHTEAEWKEVCARFNHCCAHCGKQKKLTRDHIIPLVRGGSDDISNIQPLCTSCNSRKGAR